MEEIIEQIKEQAVKVKDGAIKLTHKVIGKTSNVVDQTKVKMAISDTQGKMESVFTKIGSAVYKSHTDGCITPDFTELFTKLDELSNELDDLKEQLCRLKDTKQCPECSTYNDKNNEYCAKCGRKFDDSDTYSKETANDTFTVEINVTDDTENTEGMESTEL